MWYALDALFTSLLIAGLKEPENDISIPRYAFVSTIYFVVTQSEVINILDKLWL